MPTCLYCDRTQRLRRGMCNAHYLRWRNYGDATIHPPIGRPPVPKRQCLYCGKEAKAKRMCNGHYLRWIRYGKIERQRRVKGTGTVNKRSGYRLITVNGKQVYEHRHVMSGHLGRPLDSAEIVHHDDEIKHRNAPDNLAIMTRADHQRLHHLGKKHARKKKATTPKDNR